MIYFFHVLILKISFYIFVYTVKLCIFATEIKIDMKSFILSSNWQQNEKFAGQGKKLVLCDSNWNDFGYYTLHELFLIIPDKSYNIKLADINVFNFDQHFGEHPSIYVSSNHVSYISNIESAIRLVLFLTPDERKELFSELHVLFTPSCYKEQKVFLKSILRNTTLEEFKQIQSTIKVIVTTELNVAQMVSEHKELIGML